MDVSDVLREASVPEASNMNHIVTIMGACDDSIFLVFDLTYHQKLKLFGQQHFFRFFLSRSAQTIHFLGVDSDPFFGQDSKSKL